MSMMWWWKVHLNNERGSVPEAPVWNIKGSRKRMSKQTEKRKQANLFEGEKREMSKSAPESKSHSIVTACVNFHVCLLFDWRWLFSNSVYLSDRRENYSSTKQMKEFESNWDSNEWRLQFVAPVIRYKSVKVDLCRTLAALRNLTSTHCNPNDFLWNPSTREASSKSLIYILISCDT